MAELLNKELRDIIADPETLKVVSTVDKNGIPHSVFKGSLHINEDGNLEYYELLESAKDNQNEVYSLWFQKKVAVTILDKEHRSFEIIGTPILNVTSGRRFEKVYNDLKERNGKNSDLSGIWVIQPESVREETFRVRKALDEQEYPILKHLDRIVKTGE